MLTRLLIFTSLAAICLAGDIDRESLRRLRREEQRHKKLAAQPTPREWHRGAIWRFVTTAPVGKTPPPVLTVRVTDTLAESCTGGGPWHRLTLTDRTPPLPPICLVEGRTLCIEVAGEICDGYDTITGVFTGGEFKGERRTSGLGAAGEYLGTVQGSYVGQ
ncbi:MAG: hypothetical protein QOJ45_1103 [Verrucomicrobiota bacterium]|jgi:hypothetical protein